MIWLVAGCAREPNIFVPLQSTASRQYSYARDYRTRHQLELRDAHDPRRRKDAQRIVQLTFEKVVEYFPDDREVTPLARLELADMRAGFEGYAVAPTMRDYRAASEEFARLRADYPEYEWIQAKAGYDEARCRVKLGEFDRSQELYNYVWENYQTNVNPMIKTVAAQAYRLSQQVRKTDGLR